MRILVTSEFCKGSRKLVADNNREATNNLRTALILLANGTPIPKKFHDHQLSNVEFRELHVTGDVLLLYRYDADKQTLTVSLKLANLTKHKNLNNDATRKDYKYEEVSTQDLHDITSSAELSSLQESELTDVLESVADYASMQMSEGYVELEDYCIVDNKLICSYDYYQYEHDVPSDGINYAIDLDQYPIDSVNQYINEFSYELFLEFEGDTL